MNGRLAEAEILYGRILEAAPEQADARHLLGVLCGQTGRAEQASALIGEAMALRPDTADYPANLANILDAAGQPERAAAAHRRALSLAPDAAEGWYRFGNALPHGGTHLREAAVAALERAARLVPGDHRAAGRAALLLQIMARPHRDAGRRAEAAALLERSVGLLPEDAGIRFDRAAALYALGDRSGAMREFRHTLALAPGHAEALSNLGLLLDESGRTADGATACRRALAVQPGHVEGWVNLSAACETLGRYGAAAEAARRALTVQPGHAGAFSNLAGALGLMGRVEESLPLLQRAVRLDPDDRDARSRYLCALLYRSGQDGAGLLEESRRWAERFAVAAPLPRPANDPDPDRRLRIGLVSGDFRNHAFSFYMEPLFRAFDRSVVELFFYSTATATDAKTERFRALADRWCDAAALTEEELAARIRRDGVDVLVDLASHTAGNRLGVFTRRPAPVQVTTAVNIVTTGIDRFDACITDALLAPPGEEAHYAEPLLRLPRFSWAYQGPPEAPEVGPLPALRNGFITFGSFNNLSKITEETAALWAGVLRAVPNSRLLLKYKAMRDPASRAHLTALFACHGVASDRLELRRPPAGIRANLADYNDVDIGLDPHPYNGHTTTCEALWMGVPVIVPAGRPRDLGIARVGSAMMVSAGLPDLIAPDADAYAARAVALSADLNALTALRSGLRGHVASSPLGDVAALARAYEAAFRTLWRRWCATAR
ncbi:tetratricopeptide repeat protein [Azospirillum brasilense]|uniref:protein O-GlcNAc transferase n=1 Tax=Azospirillum brasilense TaxID=192 RepID=A0A0P0EYI9_AZOBR|nr:MULTISPECIES: tetratricopeptide repeat protein [Azospirillum]ALJ37530.1 hypothetical protein AMK58_18950 [Azospirillum brasilense]MDW7553725.1 tetratricopeptide repeat protein [Azospirillum brasilense]MDW7592836.1 tetratricopeptide repeat protein [Azospirillum brasilense]MDW7628367.1 tetratricopeptide repeat protein [Azospirillum brasilense]MDX5952306.1 tetratricopeptide repeat protein [Azospirillum brasilense]